MTRALIFGALAAFVFLVFFVPSFIVVSHGLTNQIGVAGVDGVQTLPPPVPPPVHVTHATSTSLVTAPAPTVATGTSPLTSAAAGTVVIGKKVFVASISADPTSRSNGLSGTEPLAANAVMLFAFPAASNWGFWMKDMNYPLDIIWLDASGTVVYLEKDLATSTYPEVFAPSATTPALYVIEADAGTAAANKVKVGSTILLPSGILAQ